MHKRTGKKWSEMVTLTLHKGMGLTSNKLTISIKKMISENTKNAKIVHDQTVDKENYQISSLIITYDSQGKYEMLVARTYSGPYHQAGIQYTIPPKKDCVAKIDFKLITKKILNLSL